MAKTKAEFDGIEAGEVEAPVDPLVTVRVLKKGDGKIATGRHSPRGGDELYERDEEFVVAQSIALALEDRGFAEITRTVVTGPAPVVESVYDERLDPLDHDGDGRKGGSVPPIGTRYNALTVIQLREMAKNRNVSLTGITAKEDIVAALELADEAEA